MRNVRVGLLLGILGLAVHAGLTQAAEPVKPSEMTGKELAFDKQMGNCLACHAMPTVHDAVAAGTIGPPLIAMKARFPNKADLRAQIWDAAVKNPNTPMPLYGKNKILTPQEIDKVTDFIYGL